MTNVKPGAGLCHLRMPVRAYTFHQIINNQRLDARTDASNLIASNMSTCADRPADDSSCPRQDRVWKEEDAGEQYSGLINPNF